MITEKKVLKGGEKPSSENAGIPNGLKVDKGGQERKQADQEARSNLHKMARMQIKDQLTMEDILQKYYETGKKNMVRCPFHEEETASFSYKDTYFTCFGCGEKGDTISFVQKYFDLSFVETLRKIDADFQLGCYQESRDRGKDFAVVQKRDRERREKLEKSNQFVKEQGVILDEIARLERMMQEQGPPGRAAPDEEVISYVNLKICLDEQFRKLDILELERGKQEMAKQKKNSGFDGGLVESAGNPGRDDMGEMVEKQEQLEPVRSPRRYRMDENGDMQRTWYGKLPEEFTEEDEKRFMAETDAVLKGTTQTMPSEEATAKKQVVDSSVQEAKYKMQLSVAIRPNPNPVVSKKGAAVVGFARATINDTLEIPKIDIVETQKEEGDKSRFIRFPQYMDKNGEFKSFVEPTSKEAYAALSDAILGNFSPDKNVQVVCGEKGQNTTMKMVNVTVLDGDSKTKGIGNAVVSDFRINGIRVMESAKGHKFVSLPCTGKFTNSKGETIYPEAVHLKDPNTSKQFNDMVMSAYREKEKDPVQGKGKVPPVKQSESQPQNGVSEYCAKNATATPEEKKQYAAKR